MATETQVSDLDVWEEEKGGRCDSAGISYYVLMQSINTNRLKHIPRRLCDLSDRRLPRSIRECGYQAPRRTEQLS